MIFINRYEIKKVLPVWLPQHRAYVALIFSSDEKTQKIVISGIGLDMVDIKHKASLIEDVPDDSWLNNSPNTIDKLKLTHSKVSKHTNNYWRHANVWNR